ncbi:MAG: SUMF1/EgtB/PvdO family nonheme iron enzyme [Bacteroidales bacterium]|nr:SUMF1/EgtB/PvdO family nonheme iron enzyme [Bacteroidales bacterium]
MKKLIYMCMGLALCLSSAFWTGCDKPNELDPDNGGGSGGDTTEEVYGFIKGVVTDKDAGTLISMATVELLPTDIKTQTDGEGAFSLADLNAGTYQLRVSKDGYVTYTGDDIVVNAGQTVNRSVSLEKEHAEMQILDLNGNALSELYLDKTFEIVFMLKNSGNVALAWNISELSEEWLACSEQGGKLEPAASERINLTIDQSKLPSEDNEALVYIVSEAGTVQLKVRVHMVILPEPVTALEASMVYVEGGAFLMGATQEQGNDAWTREFPAHEVTLDGFYIGKTEVTQAQWMAVVGTNPSSSETGDDYPVVDVSWDDAVQFCEKLSEMTGHTYRLPTEAEWEYAARGGQQADGTKYAGSDNLDEVAWYANNSNSATHPVAEKKANGLGLYDMSGNVWEWCSDWYGENYYANSPTVNPKGPESGESRVKRGGAYGFQAVICRVSGRNSSTPDYKGVNTGLRVVREL